MRWRNWAGNQRAQPATVASPRTEAELASVVARAASEGRKVRAVGSGHSFSAVARPEDGGALVRLDHLSGIRSADLATGRVALGAGTTLRDANVALERLGLAFANLGDIDRQTIAGAISTGTHGTGAGLGGLPTQVVGLRLVTATGEVMACSADESPEVLEAARVGQGALGVLSEVTIQAVPRFWLRAVEERQRLDAVLEGLDDWVAGHDHVELYVMPRGRSAWTKTNDRVPVEAVAAGPHRPRWKAFRDDVLVENLAFGALCEASARSKRLARWVARSMPERTRVEYVAPSYDVFTSPRYVRFFEMEQALPREAGPAALTELRAQVAAAGLDVTFPIEVRFGPADDVWLSPAHGRDTCWIAVHVYRADDPWPYFRLCDAVFRDHGGRPHWGKLHERTAADLAPEYPRWDDWQAVRARLDPSGVFATASTERTLGPVTTSRAAAG